MSVLRPPRTFGMRRGTLYLPQVMSHFPAIGVYYPAQLSALWSRPAVGIPAWMLHTVQAILSHLPLIGRLIVVAVYLVLILPI